MSTSEVILWAVLMLVGIGGSAFCSGLEVGLYSVNRVRVQVEGAQRSGARARRLQNILNEMVPSLTALLVWNNIFNYMGTLALTTLVAMFGFTDLGMILIQVVVLTPVLLVFAESTPKEVFRANADILMPRFAIVLIWLRRLVTWLPIVPVLGWFAVTTSKLVGVGSLGSLGDARERIAELLKFGTMSMSQAQVTLIDRALQLEHAKVQGEMIPLGRVRSLRAGWTIERARVAVRGRPYSRFPVIGKDGRVAGIVHAIDLYTHELASDPSMPIDQLMIPPVFLAPQMSVERALRTINRSGGHLGIVRRGDTDLGIVTRKDLVEPLVGELEEW